MSDGGAAPKVSSKVLSRRDNHEGIITGEGRERGEGHKAGRDVGYCHLEKLHNLEVLPNEGFKVVCFPCKIRAASAGWTRAVAILD